MAFPDVDIVRPIYPPPQILMNVQPSDDNPLVSSSCRTVTTGSRSRFAESPLWPCSSVLLEQPRPINPPSMTAFGPHATEVCNRFKPGRALKHRTDQTSHASTVLFHHGAMRRPRLSNPVSPLRLLIFLLLARPHTTANVSCNTGCEIASGPQRAR
jgi:hypothetical protein